MIRQPILFPPQFFNRNNLGQAPVTYQAVNHAPPVIIPPKQEQVIDTSSCSYHFRQQTLRAWYPIPTLCSAFFLLTLLGIFMIALGIVMLVKSRELSEYSVRYDTSCPTINATCTVSLTVDQIRGPVFVYYQLRNFYQNHRLYSRSKKVKQLHGKIYAAGKLDECQPIQFNRDLYDGAITTSFTGVPLDPNGPANPCGLIALTFFNDTYTLSGPGGNVPINGTDIAWKGDQQKYKITDADQMYRNTLDQRFMNWMRVASRSEFRKLWGRVDGDLGAGSYTFTITNNYDVSSINGQKWLALANANNFGGKNQLLAIIYLVVGTLFCLGAIGVAILWWIRANAAKYKGI